MRRMQIPALFTVALLAACSSGSSDPVDTDSSGSAPGTGDTMIVSPQEITGTTPAITAESPLVLNESGFVAFTAASVDVFRSVNDSCSNPEDSQYLGLSVSLEQKELLCLEFAITYSSERDLFISRTVEHSNGSSDLSGTVDMTAADRSSSVTSVTTFFATEDVLGQLPQTLTLSLGVEDIAGNLVELSTTTLRIDGDLSSNENTTPDGTDLAISYGVADTVVSTRYRDITPGQNLCVDHAKLEIDPATGDEFRAHIAAARINETASGNFHFGFVSLGPEPLPGPYIAGVYPLSDAGDSCLVSLQPVAPLIRYEIVDQN